MSQEKPHAWIEIGHRRSLRSMMRLGVSGPTSFILTITFLPTASTRVDVSLAPYWTRPNFWRKLVLMAAPPRQRDHIGAGGCIRASRHPGRNHGKVKCLRRRRGD
jgi:hypothetical protein